MGCYDRKLTRKTDWNGVPAISEETNSLSPFLPIR